MAYTPAARSPLPMGMTPEASCEADSHTTLYWLIGLSGPGPVGVWSAAAVESNGVAEASIQARMPVNPIFIFICPDS